MPSQARLAPNWKDEVNQRIAAHKNRKPVPVAEIGSATPEHHASSNRAAAAAARVAARFAKAPSYGDILENEARAALRAAEAVSRAALQAQAAAESVLAELQAAKATQPEWQFHDAESNATPIDEPIEAQQYPAPRVEEMHASPVIDQPLLEPEEWREPPTERPSYEIRWEPDAPIMHPETAAINSRLQTGDGYEGAPTELEEEIEVVEPDLPIHANLIQFPREIVATRKVRPRRAEGPFAEQLEHDQQLSIFEVEPEAVSTDPVAEEAMDPASVPTWMAPEWSGMELEARPVRDLRERAQFDQLEEPMPEIAMHRGIDQAPLTLRMMAAVVDGSLVLAATTAVTYEIVSRAHSLPAMRPAELGAAAGLLVMSAIYLALFSAMGADTPGMRYARIALCTFDSENPTQKMRFQRMAALTLSVLPVGVGVLWSLFDEDRLSWHDRLSGTFLRAY